MSAMPKKIVWTAAAILLGVALLGLYLGWNRNGPQGGDAFATVASTSSANVPAATALSAADIARGGPLDEAAIRRIAREEAQATLGVRAAPKPAATPDTSLGAEAPAKAAAAPGKAGAPPAKAAGPAVPAPAAETPRPAEPAPAPPAAPRRPIDTDLF